MKIHNELLELRKQEKLITSRFLEKLQLMEDTRAYLKLGYSSLFDYLVRAFGYSESTAYQRQSCLRLSREVPEIKEKIDSGSLSFSTVTMAYAAVKNKSTHEKREILKSIENKSSREVKKLLLEPSREVKIKKQVYQDKVILRLELSHKQHQKFEKLKALKSANHNMESLFESLLDGELKKYENTKFKTSKSVNSRYVPKRLRNHVLKIANYKCQHPNCEQRQFLQIDHILPVRCGGKANPNNLQVLCSAHNRLKG